MNETGSVRQTITKEGESAQPINIESQQFSDDATANAQPLTLIPRNPPAFADLHRSDCGLIFSIEFYDIAYRPG